MDAATAAATIVDLEAAIKTLLTGQAVEMISGPNGSLVRYQPRDVDKIQQYIAYLNTIATRRRPIFVEFGR